MKLLILFMLMTLTFQSNAASPNKNKKVQESPIVFECIAEIGPKEWIGSTLQIDIDLKKMKCQSVRGGEVVFLNDLYIKCEFQSLEGDPLNGGYVLDRYSGELNPKTFSTNYPSIYKCKKLIKLI